MTPTERHNHQRTRAILAEVTGTPREPPVCPCKTEVEEPGPHLSICPWSDPDYPDGCAF